jgi:Uma2 family endonuclease
METMDRTDRALVARPPIPIEWEADRDQLVVLRGVSWDQYEALSRCRGDAPRPLMAYLDGELELVTTSWHHEQLKTLIARLLEAFCEETNVSLNGFGHATHLSKRKKAGAEPDECYCIGRRRKAADLAIEVVHTSGGIDKLEVYRRLGVREVWFWINGRFWIYVLVGRRYEERATSAALPAFDLRAVERIVSSTDESEQTEAVRGYRRSLRRG